MTALEMKSSLLQTISEIDDAELIRKISAYVNRSMAGVAYLVKIS